MELSKVKESFASVEETKERLAQEVWKMEDERRQLRIELKEARSALLGSDKPDVARMEELRTKNEKLEETIAGKERELKEKTTELELFRELRQTATAAAVEARRETAELQKANEVLQRKADERVIRLREMQFDAQSKLKDQQISKLESQLALKKEALRKLELKLASTKGRPLGTRTVSVPQRASPGQSRTSSPGPTTLPPLTGRDLPTHPLRNNHG